MKKSISLLLAGILLIKIVFFTSSFTDLKNSGIVQAMGNKEYYEQGDIVLFVYDINCDQGIGGFTFQLNYDNDNFVFNGVFIGEDFIIAEHDNLMGTVKISAVTNDMIKNNTRLKLAVGFKALYMLDASFITFSDSMLEFVDHKAFHTDKYSLISRRYIYDSSVSNIDYEEYINNLIRIDDTQTDINTDTEEDIETDIVTDTDEDTETDIVTDTDEDTETNIDTDTDEDIETDIDTDTDEDTETNIDTDSSDGKEVIYGDVDFDGILTSGDSFFILRSVVMMDSFSTPQMRIGDVDGDGTLTLADSLEVLRYSVGLRSEFRTGKKVIL